MPVCPSRVRGVVPRAPILNLLDRSPSVYAYERVYLRFPQMSPQQALTLSPYIALFIFIYYYIHIYVFNI